jgi:uncharacterized MAPEG superfamily protein
MTIAHLCIAFAIFTPYIFTSIAKLTGPGFTAAQNHNPRDWLDQLTGYRRRAHFAQLNSFEAVPAFCAAVLVAHQVGTAAQSTIDAIAIGFVVSRLLYGAFYVADLAMLRSAIWFAGMGCIAALFAVSL